MSNGAFIVGILSVSTALVFIIRAIASSVLRHQENELKYRSGSGLLVGAEDARLQRIEHALEAIAVEVERIAENQRFTTKLLSERTGSRAPKTES